MKSGPVYEVGGSINRVYNPCRVVCQNAALSSCNRFFSDKARVANILKIQRNCFTRLNYNTVLEIKILKVRCRFCTISEHVNKAKKNRIYLESITHIWPIFMISKTITRCRKECFNIHFWMLKLSSFFPLTASLKFGQNTCSYLYLSDYLCYKLLILACVWTEERSCASG